MVVVGMSVIGVAILYATFYVWLGVDSPGSMKIVDCKLLPLMHFPRSINKTRLVFCFGLQKSYFQCMHLTYLIFIILKIYLDMLLNLNIE